jgi:hypothetical protein
MVDATAALDAVACPESTSQCAAVDALGGEVTFDPSTPGTPTVTAVDGTRLDDVACPTSGQCTAVDNTGHEVTFDPTSPASPSSAQIDRSNSLVDVSCPAASQCTAVDEFGQEVTFDPASPGSPVPAPADDLQVPLTAVACPTSSQCTTVDLADRELTFDPGAPGNPRPVPLGGAGPPTGVACPSPTRSPGHPPLWRIPAGRGRISMWWMLMSPMSAAGRRFGTFCMVPERVRPG